jgi:hypothetical protein
VRRAVVVLVLAASVLVACGGDDQPDLTPVAETQLHDEVAAIRASIEAGDDATALAQLTQLRMSVAALVTSNYVTADRALSINDAIAGLEQQLAARATSTTAVSTTVTTAATVAVTSTVPPTTAPPTTTSEPGPKKGKDKKDR